MQLTQNHFELFQLPVSFDIEQRDLADRYRELQRALHPDKFANASDRERRLSVQHAAQVNEAFQTLKTSLSRARYMLQLQGVSFDDEQDTTLDPDFLMEQMELRESLAEVKHSSDPLGALNRILDQITNTTRIMEDELRALFSNNTDASHRQAKQIVQKMQFLKRLQQEAEEVEEELVASF